MLLDKVSIGLRTFLRDTQLYNTITAIYHTLPECKIIIADCGEMTEKKADIYADMSLDGHLCFTLPFDAGFGQMSNTIASAVTTPYLLIGSDDFDFNPPEVRHGIEKLVETLDGHSFVSIASGRVNNKKYEFMLDDQGETIVEIEANTSDIFTCKVDLTVNYCLVRKEIFQKVMWDAEAKIGLGEHGSFFVDAKRAGLVTVFVPSVNINEQQIENTERYRQFRNRARSPERSCFKKRGIKKYILGDGTVDYDETAHSN